MGPKADKKKTFQHETPVSLSDPINTEEWKCAVVLIIEETERDARLTQIFAEETSLKTRKQVKSIDFERDIMEILNNFIYGEIDLKYSFLLNFSSIFEEAAEYVKNFERIPVGLMVRIIKIFIWMLKKDDEMETKARTLNHNYPIEMMAEKPLMPFYETEGSEKKDDGKEKTEKKKSTKNAATTAIRIKPSTPAKEDTNLLRRGEMVKNVNFIDDAPENSFYQLYIALTGFQNPNLPVELLKDDIPLHGVFCIQSPTTVEKMSTSSVELHAFWKDFLELLWNPNLTRYFKDVVFLVFKPSELPSNIGELRSFIFREISFLMYDLSDIKHQLRHYLRNMRLWKVDEQRQKIQSVSNQLDKLPQDCMNIPLIMQNVLDSLCGEDEEENDDTESSDRDLSQIGSTQSLITTKLQVNLDTEASFGSLLPLYSAVKLPTPRWSTIIDTDEKLVLYNKMLSLDLLYDLEENPYESVMESNGVTINVCSVKKRRLYCENLDAEIENHSGGLLMKLWMNYPMNGKNDTIDLNSLTIKLNYPELTINYFLYIIWIIRMEETTIDSRDEVPIAVEMDDISETKFTVTDGSRMALHKVKRLASFFCPPSLKIVPHEILTSLSAPEFRSLPKFSWREKSFVSDFNIPVKYLRGEPLSVFDDLRNYLGEEAFLRMKGYDFIEVLNKTDMIRRIEETAPNYDVIRHAYLPLTNCIYIVMYDNPTVEGVHRETYNVMLTTPVGLRDFYNYILDDERDWLSKQNFGEQTAKAVDEYPDSLYNPTPNFRGFTEYDFWHENSIKYKSNEGHVLQSVLQNIAASELSVKKRAEEKRPSLSKSKSTIYAEPGDSFKFVGFDFEPGAVQFSGVNTTFKGPDNCVIRASLRERLYGEQQLGVHVQQGGHSLHLYSYVCPTPHLDLPYTCHVEFRNGTLLAFSRRASSNEDPAPEGSTSGTLQMFEDEDFAYDMKLSFPHGLTVSTVRKHVNPCYIKQSYRESSSVVAASEKSRLFLPNGNVVIFLTDDKVRILKPNASIVTASLDDLVSQSKSEDYHAQPEESSSWIDQQLRFCSYTEITTNGSQVTVVNDKIIDRKQYQTIVKTEKEIQETYYRRMDGTDYVIVEDGSICVEFRDGSKIYTCLREEELFMEEDSEWVGESSIESAYSVVYRKIVMEHPDYATAIYETQTRAWRLILPCKSEIDIDSQGHYQVRIDRQTELDIDTKAIRMWRYNSWDEFLMRTTADLTVFDKHALTKAYCTTVDCLGRKFTVESNGTCYVEENEVSNEFSSNSNVTHLEEINRPKRYFVVNRDLSGFEIVHSNNAQKELESTDSDVIIHCEKLKTSPPTRYFAILKEIDKNPRGIWAVESIAPKTRYTITNQQTSSTYGKPPSWMHPFPKKKPKAPKPGLLHGRILLEIHPTNCPDPVVTKFLPYCDISDLPETDSSLSEDINNITRRVANQDQEILHKIYHASMRLRAEAKKIRFTGRAEVEKYLKTSCYHVSRRQYLKNCIRSGKVPVYFDYPSGIAWQIIRKAVDSALELFSEDTPQLPQEVVASSTESSEVEYDLERSTEQSYSDLSYHSSISGKTAPEMSRLPLCRRLLPSPRNTKSEPIYKIQEFSEPKDNLSPEGNPTPSFAADCHFTEEDFLLLAKKSSTKIFDPMPTVFELEDLMNLGLV